MTMPTDFAQPAAPVLLATGLVKEFHSGPAVLRVLDEVEFTVNRGERIAVVGASGSGKTTLLQVLGGLDLPTRGSVVICGESMTALGEAARGRLRNRAVGFVYQFHHLLPEFTALENVAMPLLIRRDPPQQALATARALLERVGLGPRLQHRPAELSGGERQRLKLAVHMGESGGTYVLDEPTTGLHLADVEQLLALLDQLVDAGKSVIVIEHHQAVMAHADWIIDLGPGAGHEGGSVVFTGTPAELVASQETLTGQHLAAYVGAPAPKGRPKKR